jgi:hypothetical protein
MEKDVKNMRLDTEIVYYQDYGESSVWGGKDLTVPPNIQIRNYTVVRARPANK